MPDTGYRMQGAGCKMQDAGYINDKLQITNPKTTNLAQLQRKIGLWTAVSIVAGSVIGSSIFMKPAIMASQLGSPGMLLLVWIVAGIFSLFGAMIMGEVASMLPETGGQFVFLKEMYSDFMAYLLGLAAFIVINTAGVAAIAFIFSRYFEYFIP